MCKHLPAEEAPSHSTLRSFPSTCGCKQVSKVCYLFPRDHTQSSFHKIANLPPINLGYLSTEGRSAPCSHLAQSWDAWTASRCPSWHPGSWALTFWRLHGASCWTWFNASRRRPRGQEQPSTTAPRVVHIDTEPAFTLCLGDHYASDTRCMARVYRVESASNFAHTPPIRCTWRPSWVLHWLCVH